MQLFGHSKNRFSSRGVAALASLVALAVVAFGSGDARAGAKADGAGSAPLVVTGKLLVPKRLRLITGFKQHGLA